MEHQQQQRQYFPPHQNVHGATRGPLAHETKKNTKQTEDDDHGDEKKTADQNNDNHDNHDNHNPHNNHDNAEDDCSSVDTNEAFWDMLGLTPMQDDDVAFLVEEEILDHDDDADNDNRPSTARSTTPTIAATTQYHTMALPPRCYKHYALFGPTGTGSLDVDVVALVLDHVLTVPECRALCTWATAQPGAFRYVTEATHTAPDGSKHIVPLQNPNPHKLTLLPTTSSAHYVQLLWERLQPRLETIPAYRRYCQPHRAGVARGLNPRLRVLRYDATDHDRFDAHFDAVTTTTMYHSQEQQQQHSRANEAEADSSSRSNKTTTTRPELYTSRLTVLLYLNDGGGHDFEGGRTLYWNQAVRGQQTQPTPQFSRVDDETAASSSTTTTAGAAYHPHCVVPQTGRVAVFDHDLYHSGEPLHWGTKYVLRTDILFDTLTDEDEWLRRLQTSSKNNNNNPPASSTTTSSGTNSTASGNPGETLPTVVDNNNNKNKNNNNNVYQEDDSDPAQGKVPSQPFTDDHHPPVRLVSELCRKLGLVSTDDHTNNDMGNAAAALLSPRTTTSTSSITTTRLSETISRAEQEILQDMGLWDISCEALWAVGRATVRTILLHDVLRGKPNLVDRLLHHVQAIVHESQGLSS